MSQMRIPSSEFGNRDKFKDEGPFGKGIYAAVRKIIHRSTGTAFAVKRTPGLFDFVEDCKRSLREILLLIILDDHPNIVKLRHIIKPNDLENFNEITLTLDFMPQDLGNLLNSEAAINEQQIKSYLYQCLLALKHLNAVNIIHRDLKPSNILLNQNGDLVLCDLNLSRMIETDTLKKLLEKLKKTPISDSDKESKTEYPSKSRPRRLTSEVVTIWWRAPEILLACLGSTASYGTRSDIWSLGIIGYQLLKKQKGDSSAPSPFNKKNNLAQLIEIFNFFGINPSDEDLKDIKDEQLYNALKGDGKRKRTKFVDLFPEADPQLTDLLDKMLEVNPEKRISPEEALNHSYFKDLVSKDRVIPEDKKPSPPFQLTNEQGQLTPAGRAAEILCELESQKESAITKSWLRNLYRKAIGIFNAGVTAIPSPHEPEFEAYFERVRLQECSLKELPCYRDVPVEEAKEELNGQPPGACVLCPSPIPGLLDCAYVGWNGLVSEDLLLISNIAGELDFLNAMLAVFDIRQEHIMAKLNEKMTLTEHLQKIQKAFENSSFLGDSDDEDKEIIAKKGPLILQFYCLPAAKKSGEKHRQPSEATGGSLGLFATSQRPGKISSSMMAEPSFRYSYPWVP